MGMNMKGIGNRRCQKNRRIWAIAAGICSIAFVCCLVWLLYSVMTDHRAATELEKLRQSYVETVEEPQEGTAPGSGRSETDGDTAAGSREKKEMGAEAEGTQEASPLPGYEVPAKTVDIEALQEKENQDIYAWITIPGTVIDYPVLQHPEELDYYLDHNLDHSSGYPGCIYSQNLNSKEWDDPNTVLYGHNMKNGTMFAQLHYYEDSEFFQENPYIYIFTQGYVRIYHIFGAYEYDNRHLLLTIDTQDPAAFAAYLVEVKGLNGLRDHFNEEVPVGIEDKILTLETCVANKPDKRYIVQAVLEAEGEWPVAEEVLTQLQ